MIEDNIEKKHRKRAPTYVREDFINEFTLTLRKILNLPINQNQAWNIMMAAIYQAASMPKYEGKNLTLSKIGSFTVCASKRALDSGKPPKRFKFRPSLRINSLLNDNISPIKHFLEEWKEKNSPPNWEFQVERGDEYEDEEVIPVKEEREIHKTIPNERENLPWTIEEVLQEDKEEPIEKNDQEKDNQKQKEFDIDDLI